MARATAPRGTDWRPEIHDSDGLEMLTGAGEQIWRPLENPPHATLDSFQDENPKGFGLIQRDRDFDHYQDDGAFYDRRPNLWVEPQGAWGKGAVTLFAFPTAPRRSTTSSPSGCPPRRRSRASGSRSTIG